MNCDAVLLSIYNALVNGASVQKMVDIMRVHIGNPIAVCNCNLKPIAYSRESGIDDMIWTYVTSEDEKLHYEFEDFGMQAGLPHKVNSSRKPVIIDDNRLSHRYMNGALFYNNSVIGNVVLLEYFRDFTEDDQYLLGRFARILSFFEGRMEFEHMQAPNAELVMMQLLNGARVARKTVSRYLFKEKDLCGYTVVVMKSLNGRIQHRPLFIEHRMVMAEYPMQKATIYNHALVMLFQVPLHNGVAKIDWDKLTRTADNMNLICGVSKPFKEIMDFNLYYDQAKTAVVYGERYAKESRCYFYQDISFLCLLDAASQAGNLSRFCHPAFTALLEYDLKNGTKWIRSLYYYLYFNCDINAAANAMGINRNSMYYRVNKIQEIVGQAFQSPNFVSQMKLSINILIFLDGEPFFDMHEIPPEYRTASFF